MNEYDIGDVINLTGTFTDATSGAVVDPSAAACHICHPDSTVTVLSVTRASTGIYRATIAPTTSGIWTYAFDGTGTAQASEEKSFMVRTQQVPR